MSAAHEFAGAYIRQLLQLVEDFINLDERGEALGMLAKAKRCMELAATPVTPPTEVARDLQIKGLVIQASASISQADSLISVSAKALREQDCEIDTDVANVLEESAWGLLASAVKGLEKAERILEVAHG